MVRFDDFNVIVVAKRFRHELNSLEHNVNTDAHIWRHHARNILGELLYFRKFSLRKSCRGKNHCFTGIADVTQMFNRCTGRGKFNHHVRFHPIFRIDCH